MNETSPPAPPSPPRRRVRRFVLRWAVFLGVLYLGLVAVFKFLENRLVFHPKSPEQGWLDPPAPDVRDVALTAADGTKLHAWWLPPADPAAGAFLVSHGNGGNLSHRGKFGAGLRAATGAGVLLYDYPGYGKSEGAPGEAGCYAAAEAAFGWLTGEAQVPAGRVVLAGESLGGGPAVEMATRHDHRALVLVYPFTSLPAAAKHHYPFLPTHTFMRNRFDNLSKIGKCRRPVFVAHGTDDRVVPFPQGEALFAAANEPKEFWRMDGYGHSIQLGPEFYEGVARFLAKHAP